MKLSWQSGSGMILAEAAVTQVRSSSFLCLFFSFFPLSVCLPAFVFMFFLFEKMDNFFWETLKEGNGRGEEMCHF